MGSNERVTVAFPAAIAVDEHSVTFRWKDYRDDSRNRQKVMTLAIGEFIRNSSSMSCRKASTASATTACSPAARAPTTSPKRVNCSLLQTLRVSLPVPLSIPASRLVRAAAVA